VFKTIIWATDGSASAEKALPVATGLAKTMDAQLVAANVEEVVIGRAGASISTGDEALQDALNEHVRNAEREGAPMVCGYPRPSAAPPSQLTIS
jgi:nucleotide-binding universal stress UspA family protein